jgi:uncharacterized protein (DUF58 family)
MSARRPRSGEAGAALDEGFRRRLPALVERFDVHGRRLPDLGRRARRRSIAVGGIDFAGHRPYAAGDDLRSIDWNLYARSRELHARQREQEDFRGLTILLDTSASMRAGERAPRFRDAVRLTALVAGIGLRRLDRVEIATGQDRVRSFDAPGASLDAVLDWLAETPIDTGPGEEGEGRAAAPSAFVDAYAERRAHRRIAGAGGGTVVWISDFAPPDSFAVALRRLRTVLRRSRLVCLLPTLVEDSAPGLGGRVELQDPETGAWLRLRVDRAMRAALVRELEHLRRAQVAMLRGVRFARVEPIVLAESAEGGADRQSHAEWLSWI